MSKAPSDKCWNDASPYCLCHFGYDSLQSRLAFLEEENLRLHEEASKGWYTPSREAAWHRRLALLEKVREAAESALEHFNNVCDHPCSATKNLLQAALAAAKKDQRSDGGER